MRFRRSPIHNSWQSSYSLELWSKRIPIVSNDCADYLKGFGVEKDFSKRTVNRENLASRDTRFKLKKSSNPNNNKKSLYVDLRIERTLHKLFIILIVPNIIILNRKGDRRGTLAVVPWLVARCTTSPTGGEPPSLSNVSYLRPSLSYGIHVWNEKNIQQLSFY